MKRKTLIALIASSLFVISLAGCSPNKEPAAAEDEILLIVDLDSQDEIYQVSMDFFVDGVWVGDAGTRNADGTPLGSKERIYQFIQVGTDLEAGLDISRLSVQFYLANTLLNDPKDLAERTVRYKVGEEVEIAAEYGNTYYISIVGSKESGFTVSLETADTKMN